MRVHITDINNKIAELNALTNAPFEPWTRADADTKSRLVANIGNYHLSQAYGGYNVHLMINTAGGVSEPVQYGYFSKRETYDNLCRYMQTLAKQAKH